MPPVTKRFALVQTYWSMFTGMFLPFGSEAFRTAFCDSVIDCRFRLIVSYDLVQSPCSVSKTRTSSAAHRADGFQFPACSALAVCPVCCLLAVPADVPEVLLPPAAMIAAYPATRDASCPDSTWSDPYRCCSSTLLQRALRRHSKPRGFVLPPHDCFWRDRRMMLPAHPQLPGSYNPRHQHRSAVQGEDRENVKHILLPRRHAAKASAIVTTVSLMAAFSCLSLLGNLPQPFLNFRHPL